MDVSVLDQRGHLEVLLKRGRSQSHCPCHLHDERWVSKGTREEEHLCQAEEEHRQPTGMVEKVRGKQKLDWFLDMVARWRLTSDVEGDKVDLDLACWDYYWFDCSSDSHCEKTSDGRGCLTCHKDSEDGAVDLRTQVDVVVKADQGIPCCSHPCSCSCSCCELVDLDSP